MDRDKSMANFTSLAILGDICFSKRCLEKVLIWLGVFERLGITIGHTKGGVGQIIVNADNGLRGLVIAFHY
jgi:hypothetical protein